MNAIKELEEQITRAHERGDEPKLRELQREYRSRADVTRISRGGVTLIERTATPTNPRTSANLAHTSRPTAVVIRPEARTTILNMEFESGMECGGLLVGHTDGDEVIVETVYGHRGSNFIGEFDRIVLDGEWFRVVDEKAQRCGWAVVGDVHSHREPDTQPSSVDKKGWRGMAGGLRQHYVGLLLSPDPNAEADRFARPQWQAFIASHRDNSLRELDLHFETGDIHGT